MKLWPLCILLSFTTVSFAATLRVPTGYATIQAAIDAAADNDTVLIADGTYSGPGNRDITFRGKAITITSEHGPELSLIDCQSGAGQGFVFTNDETAGSVLSGVTVKGGGLPAHNIGGNIFCSGASPRIENCIVRDGLAGGGAGIRCENGAPIISRCVFENNNGEGGGAIELLGCAALVVDCRIINNPAAGLGGGLFVVGALGSTGTVIRNCIISGNSGDGGGISTFAALLRIENCLITGNNGGGIFAHISELEIINSTISGNAAPQGGGILFFNPVTTTKILNSIIWNNAGGSIASNDGVPPVVSYSDVQTTNGLAWPGVGNIHVDPQFVRAGTFDFSTSPPGIVDAGDYHLQAGSPCRDSGAPEGAPVADLEGRLRPQGAGVDMGAYEFSAALQIVIDIKPGGAINTINLKSHGQIPVAIFGSTTFDASAIDPATVTLAGAHIEQKPDGRWHMSMTDVNRDGLADAVAHFPTQSLRLDSADTTATLSGMTVVGANFSGSDSVRIVSDLKPK